ncbi:MAG: helix-turn-helix domain-containing protein [Syntrophomonadaceae bacterium]
MGWGQQLKEQRERKGLSLEAIEEETKIRKYYLEALERENFSVLPPRIYAIGFVKRYAALLELDEKETIDKFIELAYGNEPLEEIAQPVDTLKSGRKQTFAYRILAAAIFMVFVFWAGNYVVGWLMDKGVSIPDDDRTSVGDQINNPPPQDEPPEPISEPVLKAEVLIEAKSDCWLDILVDDQRVYTGTLRNGESLSFEGNKSVHIHAGNAGGIDVTYNGDKVEAIGAFGEVKKVEFVAKEISRRTGV